MDNKTKHSSYWSPILYGRTYEVDFRMLAMPEYFNTEDRKWAEKYILAAIQNQNYVLEKQPRWVLINNEKYFVFASACMVEELFSEEQLKKVKKYTLDKSKTRRLYAFIGYVAEKNENGEFPTLPKFEELNLVELFQDTYLELVKDIWECRNSQPEAKNPISTHKTNINFSSDFVQYDYLRINPQRKVIKIWSSLDYNTNLWNNCAVQFKTLKSIDIDISLCLNLPKHNLDKSPFSNGSVIDIKTTSKGDKIEKSFSKIQSKDKERDLQTKKSTLNQNRSNFNSKVPETTRDVSQERNLNHQQSARKYKNRKYSDAENTITKIFRFSLSNPGVVIQLMDKKINNSNNYLQGEQHDSNFVEKSLDLLKKGADFVVSELEQTTYGENEFEKDVRRLADIAGIGYDQMKNYIRGILSQVTPYNSGEKVEEVTNFVLTSQDNRRDKRFESFQSRHTNLGLTAVNNNISRKELPSTKKQLDISSVEDTETNKNNDDWFQ